MTVFRPFPKLARLSRDMIITEKLDGTNAQIVVSDDGLTLRAGSRNRWIDVSDDNYGFAAWVERNKTELLKLGPGQHFGEWWGSGIQRGYGLTKGEKRWSLFNVSRWVKARTDGPTPVYEGQERCPDCCDVVPTLYRGAFSTRTIQETLGTLSMTGSFAAPGFYQPEGIVIFHTAAGICFKKTIKDDEAPKSLRALAA